MSKAIQVHPLQTEAIREKHGSSDTRLYNIWSGMKSRCNNKNNISYHRYGAKRVKVCKAWTESFIAFEKWALSNGYRDDLSIDRKNSSGNYSPSNCRWSSRTVQSRNTKVKRINNTSGYKGVSFHNKRQRWIAKIVVDYKPKQIGYFKTAKDAGIAYDNYVNENNLEHSINGVLDD